MENRETIKQDAERWAALMRLCGLRGHVFAEGDPPEAEQQEPGGVLHASAPEDKFIPDHSPHAQGEPSWSQPSSRRSPRGRTSM